MKPKVKICFSLVFIVLFTMLLSKIALSAPPNRILLVVMDGARYDYCTPETMPNLFSFMEKAMVFQNAYAPSSWTLPSHASLFTGLYPQQHGAFRLPYQPTIEVAVDSKRKLEQPVDIDTIAVPDHAITIADILHHAGYQAISVFGNPCYGYPVFNLHKGFDKWINVVEKKLKVTGVTYRGFYSFDYKVDGNFYTVIPNASEVAKEVTELLDAADTTKPIFLFINFEDPIATPYYFPPDQRGEINRNYPPHLKDSMKRIDDVLLPILSFFKNGLIIVTSDHGQEDGTGSKAAAEHGTSLEPPQIKIPLFIHNYTHRHLNPAAPIDLTQIMDIILKSTALDYPDKKMSFYPYKSAAFSHLDSAPGLPIGRMAIFSIRTNQGLLLLNLSPQGFTKFFFQQRENEKNISDLLRIEEKLSEMIVPFIKLERVFPASGKQKMLDENNIELLKGLGYIE